MSANWQVVEDALWNFVASASGIAGDSVIWDDQAAPKLALPFVTLHRDGGRSAGAVDERTVIDNPAATPGAEILLNVNAHVEFSLRVQVFTSVPSGNGSAMDVLGKVRNKFSAQSTLDSFETAGIAIVERGPVQNLTALVETAFESRAVLDVRLRVADGDTETATYIQTATVTPTIAH